MNVQKLGGKALRALECVVWKIPSQQKTSILQFNSKAISIFTPTDSLIYTKLI